jgi:hypothetical protein
MPILRKAGLHQKTRPAGFGSQLKFSAACTGPQWALHSGTVKPQAAWAGMDSVPAALARAAHYGSPSACGLIAQLLEVGV